MAYFIPKMKWHPNAVQKIEIFFLFLSLFDLHGRTSSYFLVCLNYLPLVFLHTAYVYSGNFAIVGVRSLLMMCFGEHPKARGSVLPTNLPRWALILMSFSVTLPDLWYFYWNNSLPSEFQHNCRFISSPQSLSSSSMHSHLNSVFVFQWCIWIAR